MEPGADPPIHERAWHPSPLPGQLVRVTTPDADGANTTLLRRPVAGAHPRFRRIDFHRRRPGHLHCRRAPVLAVRHGHRFAAARASALLYQRIDGPDGHDLGLRRPNARATGRR